MQGFMLQHYNEYIYWQYYVIIKKDVAPYTNGKDTFFITLKKAVFLPNLRVCLRFIIVRLQKRKYISSHRNKTPRGKTENQTQRLAGRNCLSSITVSSMVQ